jgi:diacylglycerol diphosphate phosphatase/phosphatidate phosphatase
VTVLGLLIALALTGLLTDLLKNAVGRPRPDLLSRCKAKAGTPRDVLVDISVCTETGHHVLHDGWRSFPSGHSSFAFAGLGYTSLFLAGQLKIFAHERKSDESEVEKLVRGDLSRALLCLVPLMGAVYTAVSRCQDYRHDVYDVCTGSLIGATIAYWSYRRYWPRLGSVRCDVPYGAPRESDSLGGNGSARGRYGRVAPRDEEEAGTAEPGSNVGYEMHTMRPVI